MVLKHNYSFVDLIIFAISLIASVCIGIYHAIKSGKLHPSGSTHGYLMGNRKMPTLPTAFSLLTSFLSGILLLGVPAEVYDHGALMWIYMISGIGSLLISALVFLPVIYRLKPTSVYEYFEHRFQSKAVRRLASSLFLLNTLVYMSIAIYAPAIALSSVTGIPTWAFILSVGLVCTFYTSIGGLKAVVWTDTLQSIFMFLGVLILVIKGTVDAGGPATVLNEASIHGRIVPLTNFDPNPCQFISFWIALFGGMAFWLSQYGVSQMAMQRYCSLKSVNQARIVIAIATPSYALLVSLACSIGLVMFAFFDHCDPRKEGVITKKDQLVILMVGRSLGQFKGLPGLFLAALCSGTLSTLSSGINSLAAVTFEDFLGPFLKKYYSEEENSRSVKIMSLIYGLAATGLAFACEPLGGLLKAAISVMGTLAGPLAGLFVLAVLVPRANKYGAFVSVVITEAILLWLCIGNYLFHPYKTYQLDTTDANCKVAQVTASNFTLANETEPTTGYLTREPSFSAEIYHKNMPNLDFSGNYGDTSVFVLYRISSYLYPILGIVMVVIIGSLVSLCFRDQSASMQISEDKLTIFDVIAEKNQKSNGAVAKEAQTAANKHETFL